MAALVAASSQAGAQQHGELLIWLAATPHADGSPAELRWTHETGGSIAGLEWLVEPELLLRRGQAVERGLHLRRAHVAAVGDAWQVRAGRQLFDWSQTDTISPADMLNPRDWSDITRIRKLPVTALSARYGNRASIEAVWIPHQQQSTLPARDWLPPPVAAMLSPAQDHATGSQSGLRVAGNWKQADLSVVWFRGHSVAPHVRLSDGPSLRASYLPLQAFALTMAKQIGAANVVRAEVARYRQQGAPGYLRYVMSLDQEWADVLSDGDTLYGILQYAGSTQPDSAVNALGWPDFNRVLERSAMFKLNYDLGSDQRRVLELSGVYNTQRHDSLWQASWQQRVGNAMTVTIAGLAMRGKDDSFWGRVRGNRRVSLAVGWRY